MKPRKLTADERRVIKRMLRLVGEHQHESDDLVVVELDDGGMGSLRFHYEDNPDGKPSRKQDIAAVSAYK